MDDFRADEITISKSCHTIDIIVEGSAIHEFGILKLIWGTDIWINSVPILKCFLAANILVWILLFVFAR